MQTQRPLVLTGMAPEAFLVRGPGERVNLTQTEDIQFKLDGLVLLVERAGRNADGQIVVFHSLATISFDDATGTYRFRVYNVWRQPMWRWGWRLLRKKRLPVLQIPIFGTTNGPIW